jgi:hypothetical protein
MASTHTARCCPNSVRTMKNPARVVEYRAGFARKDAGTETGANPK